ncbi:MAG: helix-turn-helix domain-containing protein [Christensenellaceae bacterium]
MSKESMVITGDIVKEYLEQYGITQKDLANRTGISEKHISNVLSGNSRLTEDFALKLEKVMPDVPASYWLNYESKYREQLAREKETYNLSRTDLKEVAKRFCFKEIFKGLNLSLTEQAVEMLKMLGISDFAHFDTAFQRFEAEFMEDGGEKEAIAIWLGLCEDEAELQNNDLSSIAFSPSQLKASFPKFKSIANNDNLEASLKSCRKLLNSVGVYFVVCAAVPGCKVRGALTHYKGHPAIYISGRFKTQDHVWFAILHELAHLLLHYQKNDTILSYEDDVSDSRDKEREANEFAREYFIDRAAYKVFTSKKVFTSASIRNFAAQQGVTPAIVVGQLQHDGFIAYSEGNNLRK